MNGIRFLALAAVAAIFITAGSSRAEAQLSIDIGAARHVPTATMTTLRITVLRMATTAGNGFQAASSWAWAPGSAATMNSAAM